MVESTTKMLSSSTMPRAMRADWQVPESWEARKIPTTWSPAAMWAWNRLMNSSGFTWAVVGRVSASRSRA